MSDGSGPFATEYKNNLPDLISDVRSEFGKPGLPFVIASTGMMGVGGTKPPQAYPYPDYTKVEKAQLWVAGVAQPANVLSDDTRYYWRESDVSPHQHFLPLESQCRKLSPRRQGARRRHGETAFPMMIPMNLSESCALILSLFALAGTTACVQAEPMPWKNPAYETTIRATQAESRPGPEEDPKSWNAWLRHHEDRKRWCTEQEVDLLMVGDSIVFGWSRVGRRVWNEFDGDRKAVNIGSSGKQSFEMLFGEVEKEAFCRVMRRLDRFARQDKPPGKPRHTHVAEDDFRSRRAADVAHADKQDPGGFR